MANEIRYKVHAYVCGGACWKVPTLEGWATPAQVLAARPSGCRYAVVELAVGHFQVWDLFSVAFTDPVYGVCGRDMWALDPVRSGDSLDGLIMATMLTYGGEDARGG